MEWEGWGKADDESRQEIERYLRDWWQLHADKPRIFTVLQPTYWRRLAIDFNGTPETLQRLTVASRPLAISKSYRPLIPLGHVVCREINADLKVLLRYVEGLAYALPDTAVITSGVRYLLERKPRWLKYRLAIDCIRI